MLKAWVFVFAICFTFVGAVYALDSDGDGLSDTTEQSLGSSPYQKDIFVEIDWFIVNGRNLKPRPGFVELVTAVFASAPNYNPDGTYGIRIHLEFSQGIRTSEAVLGSTNSNGDYSFSEFDDYKNAYFSPSKRSTHHYCLFVQDLGDEFGRPSGTSGISRNDLNGNFNAGASDLIVALGGKGWFNYPNPREYWATQVGTFVHELGHNLGLRHGGADHINYKPNLLSVMNYSFQGGIPYTRSDGAELRIIDYSRMGIPALNENNLNEAKGFGLFAFDGFGVYGTAWTVFDGQNFVGYETYDASAFIDWNQDGRINTSVRMNINQDVVQRGDFVDHKFSTLRSIHQWSRIVFTGGSIGKSGLSAMAALPSTTSLKCLNYRDVPKKKVIQRKSSRPVRYISYMDVIKK